jgi:hypothetical protein
LDLSVDTAAGERSPADIVLTQKHCLLNLRLSPLREIGDNYRHCLGAADPEFTLTNGAGGALSGVLDEYSPTCGSVHEFGVHGEAWLGFCACKMPKPVNAKATPDTKQWSSSPR